MAADGARLARLGFRALVFNFHDQDRLDDDVTAAVAELRRRGVARIVLVGSSMGGTALRGFITAHLDR